MIMHPNKDWVHRLLRQESVPSLGCTEPAALGYAATVASSLVKGPIDHINVRMDSGTYKNTLAVGIPGTHLHGPAVVAAAGALVADPTRKLQVFGDLSPELWQHAADLATVTKAAASTGVSGVYIHVDVYKEGGKGSATIMGRHDLIYHCRRDDQDVPIPQSDADRASAQMDISDETIHDLLHNPQNLLDCLELVSDQDLDFIADGLVMNRAMAAFGLAEGSGLGYGRALMETSDSRDTTARIKAYVAAGIEARMSGVSLPVMTSGGSGNSGLTVYLGTWAAAHEMSLTEDRKKLMLAIALAHLVNVAVKARIGRVGPLCGGSLSSAMGVGCAVAWLMGGTADALDKIIRTMTTSVAGTLCDGAKPACALKVTTGLGAALDAARLASIGKLNPGEDGLAGQDTEHAFDHLSKLARVAYVNTDLSLTSILET